MDLQERIEELEIQLGSMKDIINEANNVMRVHGKYLIDYANEYDPYDENDGE